MSIVKKCDRCGKEASRIGPVEIDGMVYDLCKSCRSALDAFMQMRAGKGSGVPKGYKRVPRPCPHFVPCADPDGCSGSELVPI